MKLPRCDTCQRQITGTLYVAWQGGHTVHRCKDCARPIDAETAQRRALMGRIMRVGEAT